MPGRRSRRSRGLLMWYRKKTRAGGGTVPPRATYDAQAMGTTVDGGNWGRRSIWKAYGPRDSGQTWEETSGCAAAPWSFSICCRWCLS